MAILTTNIGRVMIIPKGTYSPSVTYEILDLVESNGSSYVSKVGENIGNPLNDSGYWQIVTNVQPAIESASLATTQANTARDGANSAAQSATNLVNSYATDLAAKELKANKQNSLAVDGTGTKFPTVDAVKSEIITNEQIEAEVENVLNARISALEAIIAAGVFSYLQAETVVGANTILFKGAEIFLYGTAAPAVVPDFVGQFFINTTAGTTYQAKGIASAADWKQTSN